MSFFDKVNVQERSRELLQRCADGILKENLHPVNVMLRSGVCDLKANEDLLQLRCDLLNLKIPDPFGDFERWPQGEWLQRLQQLRDHPAIITALSYLTVFEEVFGISLKPRAPQ